jgi:hypothetical protein
MLNELASRIDKWRPMDVLNYAWDRYYEELNQMTDVELEREWIAACEKGEIEEELPWRE